MTSDKWWNKEYRHSLIKMIEREKRKKFKSVEPCYTGGGIYCFVGQFEDGKYFIACDTHFDIAIIDEPAYHEKDECWESEWIEKHLVKYLESPVETLIPFRAMLEWIKEHKPKGNYNMDDIDRILDRLVTTLLIELIETSEA